MQTVDDAVNVTIYVLFFFCSPFDSLHVLDGTFYSHIYAFDCL